MSTISSRTPEGEPIRCPVCGHLFAAEPSKPLMDVTCPNCGCLLVVETEDHWIRVIGVVRPDTAHQRQREDVSAESDAPVSNEVNQNLEAGQPVRIVRGTFKNFHGKIASIDDSTQEAVIEISIFGRVTSVKLDVVDLVRLL